MGRGVFVSGPMYNRSMVTRLILLLTAVVAFAGCTSREVEKDLRIVNVHTGWYDVGVVDGGMNKLVPSISFQLENVSQEDISGVQLNAVFRNVKEEAIIGEHFVSAIGSAPHSKPAPRQGDRSAIEGRIHRHRDTRADAPEQQFVDGRVMILGRHGRKNWARMSQFPIERKLLTE